MDKKTLMQFRVFVGCSLILLLGGFYLTAQLIIQPGLTRELLDMIIVFGALFVLPAFSMSFIRIMKFEQEFSFKVLKRAVIYTIPFSILLLVFQFFLDWLLKEVVIKLFGGYIFFSVEYAFVFYAYTLLLIFGFISIKE